MGQFTSRVSNKTRMYGLLERGAFGNTIPVYWDLDRWEKDHSRRSPFWGIRSRVPGGPCRLNVPTVEVRETWERFASTGAAVGVSVMVSSFARATWIGDVWDGPTGLECWGIEGPPTVLDWRELMRLPTRWQGAAARAVLARHINPSSLADLVAVLDLYPGHVVELSALDRCYGTVPGRNAVVWEVRSY